MDVDFFSGNPREKSRQRLESLLSKGVDQLAIACAFCTGAGTEILVRHAMRLRKSDSFVVVSVAPPTDYVALAAVHRLIPKNLFVHWGSLSPVEIKVGAALMHSKVFYARAGDECWLWTGSHNLTGNATQGANCEAAVMLHGSVHEKPFVDALRHLEACRNESTLYDPEATPPGELDRANILVIHAETDSVPNLPLPWHIHLCLDTEEFDALLAPPSQVRLILYPKHSLTGGWKNANPISAYSGSLTGQNLTARNPRVSRAGVSAEWRAANFCITEVNGVLALGPDVPLGPSVMTQAVVNISQPADRFESLFSEKPKIERRMIQGEPTSSPLDSDMKRYFRKQSVDGNRLVHVPIAGRNVLISSPEGETRPRDIAKLRNLLSSDRTVGIELDVPSEKKLEKRHPFIVRVKYRIRDD